LRMKVWVGQLIYVFTIIIKRQLKNLFIGAHSHFIWTSSIIWKMHRKSMQKVIISIIFYISGSSTMQIENR
jgi:hypothetical protein